MNTLIVGKAITGLSAFDAGSPAPADGTRFRIGRVWKVRDAVGEVSVAYDAFGRTVSSTRSGTPLAGSFTTEVAYDRLGRITSILLPAIADGVARERVDYSYDEASRPQSASGVVDQVVYDRWGRIVRLHYANGAVTENSFDIASGRLVHQKITAADGTALVDQAANYDDDGHLAALADGQGVTTFKYDGLNRLVGAIHPNAPPENFAYSDGGNMTFGTMGAMDYAPGSGRLLQAGGQAYGHDVAGRLASAPYGTLTFDAADHLLRVQLAGGVLDHGYDHLDRHVVTHRDGQLEFLAITDQLELRGARLTLWLSFGGRRIVSVSGAERRWMHCDLRGNLSLVTDAAGHQVSATSYSAYGLVLPGAVAGDGGGFLGASTDPSGLICLGLRWYDPRLGRFISSDPMVAGIYIIDAWNPYAYAHNNPVVFVDPSGAWSFWGGLAVAVLVAVIVVAAVFTGGAALAGLGVLASSLSSGTLVAVGIGAFGGALAGGLSAMKAGGSVWGGAILGGIIGGACALAGGAIGSPIVGNVRIVYLNFILSGAAQGAVGGLGTGFVVGFAGGKGTLKAELLGAVRGAAWGAFLGAALGFGARYLFVGDDKSHNFFEFGTFNRYIPDEAPTGDPSSFAVWDNDIGTAEDAAFTGSHAAARTLGGGDVGDIIDITCVRDVGQQTYQEIGGSLIAFGKDGSLMLVDLGQIGTAMAAQGLIAVAADMSVILDANGFSYASQIALLLKNVPVLGNALAFVDEYKLGWYEDATKGFDGFWSSQTKNS